ncbi:MAG: hypothetical protein ABI253_01710 [Mycobacterium sp.]
MITVGNSGTRGIGGMVITEGNDGRRWRCEGSAGTGACCAGGCFGGACWGGAADGVVLLLVALAEELVVLPVVLVVLDELLAGAVLPPPGPRLVNCTMPQITSASITAMSPTQAISTDLRRNQGVGGGPAKPAGSGPGGGCCSNGG